MEYWILQHNPAILRDCPNPPGVPTERTYWRISRYANSVNIGDVAFIWYAGRKRGIYQVAKLVSVPPHRPDAENQIGLLWRSDFPCYDPEARRRLGQHPSILIDIQCELASPLLVGELSRNGFADLPVIRMPWWGGIYKVEHSVGQRLLEYIRRTQRC